MRIISNRWPCADRIAWIASRKYCAHSLLLGALCGMACVIPGDKRYVVRRTDVLYVTRGTFIESPQRVKVDSEVGILIVGKTI